MVEVVTVEDIADWDADLAALTDGLGWLFDRPEPKVTFGRMIQALLADVQKKKLLGTGRTRPSGDTTAFRASSGRGEVGRGHVAGICCCFGVPARDLEQQPWQERLNKRDSPPHRRGRHLPQSGHDHPFCRRGTGRADRRMDEQRRYLVIELLTKARLAFVDGETTPHATEPVPVAIARATLTRILPVIVFTLSPSVGGHRLPSTTSVPTDKSSVYPSRISVSSLRVYDAARNLVRGPIRQSAADPRHRGGRVRSTPSLAGPDLEFAEALAAARTRRSVSVERAW